MIKRYLIQNWDGVSSEANMDRPAGAGLLLLPGPGITPFKVSYLCILYPLYLGWSSCQGRWVKTRWSEWQGFTNIKRWISCTSFFFNRCSQRGQEHYSSAVQESLQTEPVPSNPDSWQDWNEVNAISIDQVVLTDSIRWRDRDLGFLLPLAVTGKKIQVGSHYQSHSYVTFIDIMDMHTTSKGVLPAHESNEHCRYLWFGFNLEPELQLYHHQKRGWRSSCASVGMATYLSGSSVDFAPLVTRSRLCWIFDQGTSRCLSMITMSNLFPA